MAIAIILPTSVAPFAASQIRWDNSFASRIPLTVDCARLRAGLVHPLGFASAAQSWHNEIRTIRPDGRVNSCSRKRRFPARSARTYSNRIE